MAKRCTICNTVKDYSEFYTHLKSADGYLSQCKECVKKRVDKREKALRQNPEWVEKEKIRAREKYHRLGYRCLHKPSHEKKKEIMGRYNEKYPEKRLAKSKIGKKIKAEAGNELHHWCYKIESALDVIELSVKSHQKAHRYIVYDQERMMYRRIDNNELLISFCVS
jgi:hypothetical protein